MSRCTISHGPAVALHDLVLLFFFFWEFSFVFSFFSERPCCFSWAGEWGWQQRFSSSHHPSSQEYYRGNQPLYVERSSLVPKSIEAHGVQVQFIDGTWKQPIKDYRLQLTIGQQFRSNSLAKLIHGRIAIGQTACSKGRQWQLCFWNVQPISHIMVPAIW